MSDQPQSKEEAESSDVKRRGVLRRLPVYVVLLALYPLVYLYSVNVNYTNLWELPRALMVVAALSLVVWGATSLFLWSWHKGAVYTSLLFAAFFTYALTLTALRPIGLGRHIYLVGIEAVIFAGLFVVFRLSKRDFGKAAYALNLLSVIMIAIALGTAAKNYDWSTETQQVEAAKPITKTAANKDLPDIYYIVPDAYGRTDIFKKLYDYDNSAFIDALRDRGFYVAEQATCNYWMTLFSMSSSMQMAYHENLAERWVPGDKRSKITVKRSLRAAVAEGEVLTKLRELGYTVVSFSSGYSVSETVAPDIYISPGKQINEFEQGVLDMTILRWVLNRWNTFSPYNLHRHHIDYLFDHFADAAKIPGPKFVLIHLPVPHPPFVFGENGEDVSPYDKPYGHQHGDGPIPFGKTNQDFIEKYRGQTAYASKRILQGIDEILEREDAPPVILLQGDHGPMANRGPNKEVYNPGERFPILSAYYLPGHEDTDLLYPSITPVNSFRVVFNLYFDAGLELLEDRNIINTGASGVYEATEQVQKEIAEIQNATP